MIANNYAELNLYLDFPEYLTSDGWKLLGEGNMTPIKADGRTLVPVRAVIEAMGGAVEYIPETDRYLARITCRLNGSYAQMWIGSSLLVVDGEEYQFDVMPQISICSVSLFREIPQNSAGSQPSDPLCQIWSC